MLFSRHKTQNCKMDHSEEDFPAFLARRRQGRQSQVIELFEKTMSWRDESYRQMSDIISSHNKSIDKGYNELIEEVFKLKNQVSVLHKERNVWLKTLKGNNDMVSDLQAEVSVLRKEKIVLLETVKSLNGDRRQVSAKQPSERPEVQEMNSSLDKMMAIKEESVETSRILKDSSDEESIDDDEDGILNLSVQQHNKTYSRDNQNHLYNSTANQSVKMDAKNIEQVGAGKYPAHDKIGTSNLDHGATEQNPSKYDDEAFMNLTENTDNSKDFVCQVCKFAFSTSVNLSIHMKNVHSSLELSKLTQEDDEKNKRLNKRKQCYPARLSINMPPHEEGDNQSNIQLKSPNGSNQESDTGNNKTCNWKLEDGGLCGKRFKKNHNLNVHMRVHQDVRPFGCSHCSQTFRQKAHLKKHEGTHEERS